MSATPQLLWTLSDNFRLRWGGVIFLVGGIQHLGSSQKYCYLQCSRLCQGGGLPPSELHKHRHLQCSHPCPSGDLPSKLPKYRFTPLPRSDLPPSKLPKYCHLQCSHTCTGGVCHPRSYQSIDIYNVRAQAQVGSAALEVTKVSLFILFAPCPDGDCRPRRFQSIAI